MENRCLEEGAEEFFLKPVRLSDLNKLKPCMMKTKIKDQPKEEDESDKPESESPPQLPQQIQQESQQQQQQQQQPPPPSNNKRKAMEEGLSPERTRPRYNGIATLV